jgi:hypothetical protein
MAAATPRVVDTSAWIEWPAGSALGKDFSRRGAVLFRPSSSSNCRRHQGADLLTCDRHFEGLRNTMYFHKTERA